MPQQAKRAFLSVFVVPRRLAEKLAFVAIWGAAHQWGTAEVGHGAREFLGGLLPLGSRQSARRRVKRILIRVPGIRTYLAEKHTLQESWYQLAAELDAIKLERDCFEAEAKRQSISHAGLAAEYEALASERSVLYANLERHRLSIDALLCERDALLLTREQLQADVIRLSALNEGLTAKHKALASERSVLHADLEKHRLSISALVCERDALFSTREQLQAEVKRQSVVNEGVTAKYEASEVERSLLHTDLEQRRLSIEELVSERDALLATRELLQVEVKRQSVVYASLAAEHEALVSQCNALQSDVERHRLSMEVLVSERDALLTVHEQLQSERSNYQHAMLGKLSMVQSQLSAFQRGLKRLEETPGNAIADEVSRNLYLELLEDSLVGTIIRDESIAPGEKKYDPLRREIGRDWPKLAFTMIGKARMRNLREMVEMVVDEKIPGDFLEAGVWRGGACIYVRGILRALGITDRAVWVADSFSGLPRPDVKRYPADTGDQHHTIAALAVSLEEVRDNFSRFDLLDKQVRFLKGWFKDTLPRAPVKQLALLRLDGDMYESTIQTLDAMYWKLSPRGVVIIDDYILPACKKAVDDFRDRHGISAKLEVVDGAAVYWRKPLSEKIMRGRRSKPEK